MRPPTELLPRTRNGRPRASTTADVVDYWVERLRLQAPASEACTRYSMGYQDDRLQHYGHWWLADAVRAPSGWVRVVYLNAVPYHKQRGGMGPNTNSRLWQVQRSLRAVGAPIEWEANYSRVREEQNASAREAWRAKGKRLTNTLYREITTTAMPFGSGKTNLLIECVTQEYGDAFGLLPFSERYGTLFIGPVGDERKHAIRRALDNKLLDIDAINNLEEVIA